MSRLRVFNVGHGETMVINLDGPVSVIRDFGQSSYHKHTATSTSIQRIIDSRYSCNRFIKSRQEIDAVLSHPHEDHFNGFLQLHKNECRRIFNRSYIPWLDFTTLNTLSGRMLILSSYLVSYYGLSTPKGQNASHWILMAPVMSELSHMLYGVCERHTMNHWNPKGIVLWPPAPTDHGFYSPKRINRIIEEIEGQINDSQLIEQYYRRVINPLFEILQLITPINPDEPRINENIDSVSRIRSILDIADSFNDQFNNLVISYRSNFVYKQTIDDHSIVFELDDNGVKKALFLSDLHPSSINKMIRGSIPRYAHYKIIKSAHHGTRFGNAFRTQNITAEISIHCCGPAHPNWNGPDQKYFSVSKKIYCTDWNHSSKKWINQNQYKIFIRCCQVNHF